MTTTTPPDGPHWQRSGDRWIFVDPIHHFRGTVKATDDGKVRYVIYRNWPESDARAAEAGTVGTIQQGIDIVNALIAGWLENQ